MLQVECWRDTLICRMQAVGKCICSLKLEARMVAAVGGAPGGCSWNGQFFPSSLPLAARQCPPRIMIQPRPPPFHHSFSPLSNLRSSSPTWLWWDPPSRNIWYFKFYDCLCSRVNSKAWNEKKIAHIYHRLIAIGPMTIAMVIIVLHWNKVIFEL